MRLRKPGRAGSHQERKQSRSEASKRLRPTLSMPNPRTLRLVWGQRELELQALRRTLRHQQDTREYYIRQEVAGCPAHRSHPEPSGLPSQSQGADPARPGVGDPQQWTGGSVLRAASPRNWLSQETLLQRQIQKLTLDLQEQKEQAQLEKEHLEEQLLQSCQALQQVEAELQAFRRSCLLQLARSSWVGRVLRSSTGSVEVVTAENLVDLSDFSEDDRVPATGEGFRMEDVDWNSIAHRYPNLLSNLEPNTDEKFWRPQNTEVFKSVEWGSLPNSLSRTDSGSSSSQQTEYSGGLEVPELPATSEQRDPRTERPGEQAQEDPEGQCPDHLETSSEQQQQNGWAPGTGVDPEALDPSPEHSPPGSCLRIVNVSRRERCICILNQSSEQTVDLTGHMLVQRVGDFPVSMYRFPSNTQLEAQHHVTVWSDGICSTKKAQPWTGGQQPTSFQPSQRFLTVLLNPEGEVLSSFRAPHCVSQVSRLFEDNTDLSIDRFPLTEAKTVRPRRQPRAPRRGRARRQRPRMPEPLPGLCSCRLAAPRDADPGVDTPMPQPLPPTTPELGPCVDQCQDRKERKVQVGRKRVDRTCPMVALSVQNTAESKFGFRFLSYPPITVVPLAGAGRVLPCQRRV
ncbi:lamin tail domain-containing protein 2 [Sorex araneus]|uniref:lamin tail domain-containing protein 2 n=1 Tax=Sorex araneus TaxID=42254 RepID=UPI0024334DD4|nr:lamin tail domain-containing protein 2 [Sorex araneus]